MKCELVIAARVRGLHLFRSRKKKAPSHRKRKPRRLKEKTHHFKQEKKMKAFSIMRARFPMRRKRQACVVFKRASEVMMMMRGALLAADQVPMWT
nr:hypothetical protein Itr_chr13CG02540 [Ipomoea trifida]